MAKKKKNDGTGSRGIFFQNYDYTPNGPNKTSPGGSPYHGKPGGGEKSMGDFIKKRRSKLKRFKGFIGLTS